MAAKSSPGSGIRFLPKTELAGLVEALRAEGYTVVAPVLVDGVVALRAIRAADELVPGVRDRQGPGHYRAAADGDGMLFAGHTVGPYSPKRWFFPPTQLLFGLHIEGGQFVVDEGPPAPPKIAFLGIRPCDVAAMNIQDRVFGTRDPGTFRCESNPYQAQTRQEAMVIAVNCSSPGDNCYCTSTGTGPVAGDGVDLAMTELRDGFMVRIGSGRGQSLIARLNAREPSSAEVELVELRLAQAKASMKRRLNTEGLPELLERHIEHPMWDQVASRCLGCGNCTMVCPTCFCSSIVDASAVDGKTSTRTRQWESCFTHQFTYTTSGPVRSTIKARYRHWLRHKFGTWIEQFGVSGCVGCGRCLTWCPVGIDVIEQLNKLRDADEPAAPRRPQGVMS